MYGDDVGAVVVDPGTCTTKIGYAGEDCPKIVTPSVVGQDIHTGAYTYPVYENVKRDNIAIRSALRMESSLLAMDSEILETLLQDSIGTHGLRVNSAEHPLVIVEPNRHNTLFREKLTELAFEKLNVPAFFVVKKAPMSSFACGRTTSLVVDVSHSGTSINAIMDGYSLQKTLKETNIGGQALEKELEDSLIARGINVESVFGIKKKLDNNNNMTGINKIDVGTVHPSYLEWSTKSVIRHLKETTCRVSEQPLTPEQIEQYRMKLANTQRSNTQQSQPVVCHDDQWVLPDGTPIDVSLHARIIPECIFRPELLSSQNNSNREYDGLSKSVYDILMASDADIRRELASGIVLSGGVSQTEGLVDRLQNELQDPSLLGPALRFKLIAPSASAERKFSAWLGGSIIASLGSFQQLWISKEEYEEHGARIVEKKCP